MSDRDHGDVVVLAPVARSLDNLSGFTSAYRTRAVEAEEFSALVGGFHNTIRNDCDDGVAHWMRARRPFCPGGERVNPVSVHID